MEENHWKNKFHKKIKEKTGLEEYLVVMYDFFIEASGVSDGIVMPSEVTCKLKEFIEYAGDNPKKYNIEEFYGNILKEFKEKGLVEDYKAGNGTTYPKIIGYNYYNDEEFYFKTRRKGDKTWNGRISKGMLNQEYILRNLAFNQEFENKELEQTILN